MENRFKQGDRVSFYLDSKRFGYVLSVDSEDGTVDVEWDQGSPTPGGCYKPDELEWVG